MTHSWTISVRRRQVIHAAVKVRHNQTVQRPSTIWVPATLISHLLDNTKIRDSTLRNMSSKCSALTNPSTTFSFTRYKCLKFIRELNFKPAALCRRTQIITENPLMLLLCGVLHIRWWSVKAEQTYCGAFLLIMSDHSLIYCLITHHPLWNETSQKLTQGC